MGGNGPGSGHFGACLVPKDERSLSRFVSDGSLTSLDEGLYALACEEDVRFLATIIISFKLIQHDSSEPTKELVWESVTPRSLPEHDSRTPCKDSVYEFVTPRCMPHCMLTPPSDESVITYTQLSGVQGVNTQDHVLPTIHSRFSDVILSFVLQQAIASQVINDVMRQLSFEETKLNGKVGFADVAKIDVKSFGLSHDELFRVDDLNLNLNEPINLNVSQIKTQYELPMSEEPDVGRTQEPIMAKFFYYDGGIDNAFEIEYDIQSSKDAGTIDDDDDEDEDFLVDEENEVVEPDVDVYFFSIIMDVSFDNIGVTNLVPDDVLKGDGVDVINADGFDSAPSNDDKTSNYRREYVVELQPTNLNTTVKIVVERNTDPSLPTRVFQRIYVCLGALKLGFRACRRELLGLDGAFMNWPFPGQVLAAVGLDSNNGIYPLAYALVEAKSRAKFDLLLNNICEVFNGKLVGGRDKPVIILLEYIREYCMKRIDVCRCVGVIYVSSFTIYFMLPKPINNTLMGSVPGQMEFHGSHKSVASDVNVSLKTIDGNSVSIDPRLRTSLLSQILPVPGQMEFHEASSCESKQAQQAKLVVSQDGSGGSGVGVVIGLSAADGQGGAGGAWVGVGGQDSDSELLIPTIWSDESKNEKKAKRWREEFEWKRSLFEIDLTDLLEISSEAVEHGMDDHVPDEIDGAKCEQLPNHVVKKGNLEFLVCKQVANHGGDELVGKGRPLKRIRMYAELMDDAFTEYEQLEIIWCGDHLYEMHLLLNPSQREELENGLTSREELVVLQVEFVDMEGQMQQVMEELKRSQKIACFWKSIAIVFGVVASFMFVMN
uniref:Putative transposase, mutator type, MULE transposase domain protein n=1 Tax=Tanacetum cinerariifolium TaxID=118510 RepID=A0A6L2KM99_TANCI|nr:putative transposase, mutator type, MULE transposase domain protein [Tanacetum cinerariifolium]